MTMVRVESGLYASIAVNGDVQIGWCRRVPEGWCVEDMDCNRLMTPFPTKSDAEKAGYEALAHESGASNPGW
ncbi:hypothetical protein [Microvirga brassicacearum]|uniref:Uncharacterized protein n=1 Tax=Microvirga brassicacearum TaxID=2580413 RepID=A0A5N3P735_9HYPH|nr:hypothetical protein [Microvirga brassicacearum]KAB0265540.1 hypothetical protein FEZ63_17870 [Microvirga brassicacearum]